MPHQTNPEDHVDLNLNEIQGNILAGFNNDHQRFLFLRIDEAHRAKIWLKALIPEVSSTRKVKTSTTNSRLILKPAGPDNANWLNVAFNSSGFEKLGASHLQSFLAVFPQGVAHRSVHLGDSGRSAPDQGDPWFRDRNFLDVILLLSPNDSGDLASSLAAVKASLVGSGLILIHTQVGENAPGLNNNEHFGFKDGISQPGIKGFTLSSVLPQITDAGHQGPPDSIFFGRESLSLDTQPRI